MPSGPHESPLELTRRDPDLIAWLLAEQFGLPVPAYDHAGPHPTEVRELIPRTYHADGVVAFHGATGRPVLGVVVEVQRRRDEGKLLTWKLYAAALEVDLTAPVAMLVFCPTPVATWYARRLAGQTGSLRLEPCLVTPERVPLVTDAAAARAHPAAAVLAAVLNGSDPGIDQAFPALAEALLALGPERSILYYDVVLAGLSPSARPRWEYFMTTVPTGYAFQSEVFRRLAAEGEAKGEARAVLAVLAARGLTVPDALQQQVLTTTDLDLLERWLQRAATATAVEDVFPAGSSES